MPGHELRLLRRALNDIAELHKHIAKEDKIVARNVVERIDKALIAIRNNPNIGRPTQRPPIREWSVPGLSLVIPYRVKGTRVEILRVYHTRRRRPLRWE
ncbi:hypothetical protein GCM10007874_08830 [Labrys miyagiensis]|uniref:Plasmid stabilization system protein ParE n=1 Tax=Labrys miyagiensis TaxID=346912 RepID=A0ABQ6CBW5_9HYPH|nr:type II toxin-antitoxin system RelE/ParE family toxin [Labrys miyagiensis]GLS17867.1 hypothetical protein GCM10007874_08830 [Labrys miyagiensis]